MAKISRAHLAGVQARAPQAVAAQAHGRVTRHRMVCEWSLVLDMLTSGKRKHADGRTLTEVWADLVLENPPLEFARVARELLPQEDAGPAAAGVTNVQQLYLMAVQAANVRPGGEISDTTSHETIEGVAETPQGANGVQPTLSDW